MGLIQELFKEVITEEMTARLSDDSADAQIDSILLKYQNESSVEDEDVMAEGYAMPNNWKLLLEADEEDSDEDMSVGDEEQQSTEPTDPRNIKINVDDYAQKVANLYENYDQLLNMKAVIINRAKNLLEKGYAPDLVDEFLEVLEREFGISLEGDVEPEYPMAPAGGSAGPIGAV